MKRLKRISIMLAFLLCFTLGVQAQIDIEPQTGHIDNVQTISVSPDGKYLISGSHDFNLILWDIKTGLQLKTWPMNASTTSVRFSRDGKYFTGVCKNKAIVIETATLETVFKTEIKNTAGLLIDFSPDNKTLYIVSRGDHGDSPSLLTKVDISTGKMDNWTKIHDWLATSLEVHPDGGILLTSSLDKKIIIRLTRDFSKSKTVLTGEDQINDACFAPDGKSIFYAMGDKYGKKIFRIGEVGLKNKAKTTIGAPEKNCDAVAVSPNYKFVAAGGFQKEIQIWNYNTKELVNTIKQKEKIISLCFSNDNQYIFAASGRASIFDKPNNYIAMYKVSNGKLVKKFRSKCHVADQVTVSNNYKAISSYEKIGLRIWDMREARILKTIPIKENVRAIDITPDGKYWAYVTYDSVFIFNENDEQISKFKGGDLNCLKLMPDGKKVLVGGYKLSLYNVADGKELQNFKVVAKNRVSSRVWNFSHSSDFSTIVYPYEYYTGANWADSKYQTDVFDITGTYKYSINLPYRLSKAAFSPDDKKFALYGSQVSALDYGNKVTEKNKLFIFNAADGKQLLKIENDKMLINCIFPNNDIIYAAHRDGTISVYDANTGQLIKEVAAHNGWIEKLSICNRYMLSVSHDCRVKMWKVPELTEVVSFIASDEKEYSFFTPENYYLSSKSSTDGVGFRIDKNIYPFKQFDIKYNRPDIVLKNMGFVSQSTIDLYHKAYLKRLKQMELTEEAVQKEIKDLPVIQIIDSLPTVSTTRQFAFKIKAESKSSKLSRIHLLVNEVPEYGVEGQKITEATNSVEKELSLPLCYGNNTVSVAVQDEHGILSLEETFDIFYEEEKPADLHIITIGVSKFTNPAMNLRYAAKDAKDIETYFKTSQGFANIYTHNYTDAKATKANILKLKPILQKTKVDDMVIIFVASHGLLDENLNYYIATYNTNFTNPAVNGLPYESLEGLIDGIPARKKLVMIDACHSGEIDKEVAELTDNDAKQGTVKMRGFKAIKTKTSQVANKNAFELMKTLFADIRRGTGAIVISAAGGAEFAFESPEWKNGVFTYSLLEGMKSKNADMDKDGSIVVSELRDYTIQQVQKLTNGRQTPTTRKDNLKYDFKIGL